MNERSIRRYLAFAALAICLMIGAITAIGCADPVPPRFNLEVTPPHWVKDTDTETELGSAGFSRVAAGGLKIQQISAETSARLKLSDRVYAIALDAAGEIFTKESDQKLAQETALTAVSLADSNFYRAAIAWSPAQDYFVLYRVSHEALHEALETAFGWSIGESRRDQNGAADDYDKLRVNKAIDRAIGAAKEDGN
ncbi:hypothetical protein FACS189487_01380 [Campylobacterota bacterium]|nr:hypothetical protein FACS189487_01380 [Campylobacterota bacterium]